MSHCFHKIQLEEKTEVSICVCLLHYPLDLEPALQQNSSSGGGFGTGTYEIKRCQVNSSSPSAQKSNSALHLLPEAQVSPRQAIDLPPETGGALLMVPHPVTLGLPCLFCHTFLFHLTQQGIFWHELVLSLLLLLQGISRRFCSLHIFTKVKK